MNEKQIQNLMVKLEISREEAIQLMEEDKAIDRGANLYELDPELEKGAKKARQAERKANSTMAKREKKPKPEKEQLCNALMEGLRSLGVEEFSNPEREFTFAKDGKKYKVTLACPRS